jgi:hypothetical protein
LLGRARPRHRPRARRRSDRILAATADRHSRQIVQELAYKVLEATEGSLRDDATTVCLDWLGADGSRDATGGSSRLRATAL